MKIAASTLIAACGLSIASGCISPQAMLFAAALAIEKAPVAPPTASRAQAKAKAQAREKARSQAQAKEKAQKKAVKAPAKKVSFAPIVVTLRSDKKTYKRGETVSFVLTARGASVRPQTLSFSSGQSFDITARLAKAGSLPAWQWSRGRYFIQVVSVATLRKGEERVWKTKWRQTDDQGSEVPRGAYRIEARLAANNGITAAPITITLVD